MHGSPLSRHRRCLAAAVLLAATGPSLQAQKFDFAELYPAQLDAAATEPLDWESTADDVWELNAFNFEVPKQLKLKLRASTVVFGRHGTNALWALVLPEKAAKISSSTRGEGEEVRHIWLRFHPARIGELFPAKTIAGKGDAGERVWGTYVTRYKREGFWSEGNRLTVPESATVLVDVETTTGKRRPYVVDLERGSIDYETTLQARMLPDLVPIEKKAAVGALEAAATKFAEDYDRGPGTPQLDWKALGKDYARRAGQAHTTLDTGMLVWGLLSGLGDSNVYVRVGEETLPGFGTRREFNADASAVAHILGDVRYSNGIPWSRTPQDVGYIRISRGYEEKALESIEGVLEILGKSWALIVDLRFNGSISEETAQAFAGRFAAERHVYGFAQTLAGGKLGERRELSFEPRGPWRYKGPLYVIVGRGTSGPGERLAMMLSRLPGTITLGELTAGASLSSAWVPLSGDVAVYMPSGLHFDHEGAAFDGVGLTPDVPIEVDIDAFDAEHDPVLYRVLEEALKVPAEKRVPGNRED